jgi:agmatine deiminase
MLGDRVRAVELSSNDSWMRDCGPTFLINKHRDVRGIDWRFNAWGGLAGGLYFPWDLDDAVASKVLEIERADRYEAPLVLEGGSIHVDGAGTAFTTEECLLNPNRNGHLTQAQIESALQDYLGVRKIIWLGQGVYRDETSGHIDNLMCPVRPGIVALAWCDDADDPQHAISRDAFERLSRATDARGKSIEIVKVPMPSPVLITEYQSAGVDHVHGTLPRRAGDRLAASYVNYYTCNRGIIMPLFDDPRDVEAAAILQQLYPDREVVGVPAREILLGGGNIHCITQQQPAGRAHEHR